MKLVDTFRVVNPDEKRVGTFCNFGDNTTGEKIDYIFTLPGTKILAA